MLSLVAECEAGGAMAILFGGWKGDTGTDAKIAVVGSAVSVVERVPDRREY